MSGTVFSDERTSAMTEYRKNRLVQIGFWLLVIGAGPLFGIIILAEIDIWSDPNPNPNPIGPGLLFFFTFWPAMICLVMGVFQVRRKQRSRPGCVELGPEEDFHRELHSGG